MASRPGSGEAPPGRNGATSGARWPDDRAVPDEGDTTLAKQGKSRAGALPIGFQHHPAVLEEQARRASDAQLRVADWITSFAGSMNFVYLHVVLFTVWMLFVERSPWPTLTLIVSLEAIF